MSLRELAKAHLERLADGQVQQLSQRDALRGVPTGQKTSSSYFPGISAVPRFQGAGTADKPPEQTVLGEQRRYSWANRTVGTTGTIGTAGTAQPSAALLQAVADKRNETARRAKRTDRWCRCGRLAEFAWPLEGRREVWSCLGCAPAWRT